MQGQVIMEAKNVKQEGGTAELGRATRRQPCERSAGDETNRAGFLVRVFQNPTFFF
jgi:hypothetical protein